MRADLVSQLSLRGGSPVGPSIRPEHPYRSAATHIIDHPRAQIKRASSYPADCVLPMLNAAFSVALFRMPAR